MSFDEHAIPRWTKKFSIPKGYITTRNKYMRCEKLYCGYDLRHRLLSRSRPHPERSNCGSVEFAHATNAAVRQPASLHAVFDAGAGKSDADVRALLTLAETTPNLDVTLRACRYPHRVKIWKQLPPDAFTSYEEPGDCQGAAERGTPRGDVDGPQGRKRSRGRAHHYLSPDHRRPEEGPLASPLYEHRRGAVSSA